MCGCNYKIPIPIQNTYRYKKKNYAIKMIQIDQHFVQILFSMSQKAKHTL